MRTNPRTTTRDDAWRTAILLTAALTAVRLIAIFRTPIGLYPDEAQYWLWSRTLDFGYFSKPPMVAWSIWLTTRLGDAEPWVRLSAPLFQAGATLCAYQVGRRLYGATAGLAAAAIYALTPAIQLSSAVVATDAPLLFFVGLTVLAYTAMLEETCVRRRLWLAAGFGAGLGLAFLSKYAAIYILIGVGLHAVLSRDARRCWPPAAIGAALAALGCVLAPNLIWNAGHGFATMQHTVANAAWDGQGLFNLIELARFIGSQFAVFGPIPFGVLLLGSILLSVRRRLTGADLMLVCLTAPALVLVSAQAFISRANANWSGAAYLTGAVLAGAWLVRWRAQRWLVAALATQTLVAVLFLTFVLSPRIADRFGAANSFKRAKAWDQTTQVVLERARTENLAGLSAIAVNNRFLYYALSYYGRDYFHDPASPPLRAWLLGAGPENQSEASAPLTMAEGQRVLAVSYEGWWAAEMQADFDRSLGREISRIWLDRKHQRRIEMFVGEGFRPRPRDPATGRPTPP